jgi:predicted DNA-binding ribbon-helix-helix protein
MQAASNVCFRFGGEDLARLQQLIPTLRRKTGADCNLSSVMRQCVLLCLDHHVDELIADLKEVAA